MNIIEQIEKEQMAAVTAKRSVPDFAPGDTVKVMVRVAEEAELAAKGKAKGGKKEQPKIIYRLQAYEGVVIARAGAGINESFTVRKISYGEGVERVFPVYSPFIAKIEVLRRGRVRRAKLHYLRGRRGKAARILERTDARAKRLAAQFKSFKRPKGQPDDLTKIATIDKDLETQLKKLNVLRYDQIAAFSDEDIAILDHVLGLNGRIERENWVGIAKRLMVVSAVTGESGIAFPASNDAARRTSNGRSTSPSLLGNDFDRYLEIQHTDSQVQVQNVASLAVLVPPTERESADQMERYWKAEREIEAALAGDNDGFLSLLRSFVSTPDGAEELDRRAIAEYSDAIVSRALQVLSSQEGEPQLVLNALRFIAKAFPEISDVTKEADAGKFTELLAKAFGIEFLVKARMDCGDKECRLTAHVVTRLSLSDSTTAFLKGPAPADKFTVVVTGFKGDLRSSEAYSIPFVENQESYSLRFPIAGTLLRPSSVRLYNNSSMICSWSVDDQRAR